VKGNDLTVLGGLCWPLAVNLFPENAVTLPTDVVPDRSPSDLPRFVLEVIPQREVLESA